jgi:hypothetical protein
MPLDLSTDEALAAYAKTCPEVVLWTLIDSMGGMAWRLRHDASRDGGRGYITDSAADSMFADAAKLQARVALIATEVARFGVQLMKRSEPVGAEIGRHAATPVVTEESKNTINGRESGALTDDYWRWYKWWAEYVRGLGDKEFRELDKAMTEEQDVSRWRPQGDWRAPSPPLSNQPTTPTA